MEFLFRLPHIRYMHLSRHTERRGSLQGRISVLLFGVAYRKPVGRGVAPASALRLPCTCLVSPAAYCFCKPSFGLCIHFPRKFAAPNSFVYLLSSQFRCLISKLSAWAQLFRNIFRAATTLTKTSKINIDSMECVAFMSPAMWVKYFILKGQPASHAKPAKTIRKVKDGEIV
jgi:hypothetical protein